MFRLLLLCLFLSCFGCSTPHVAKDAGSSAFPPNEHTIYVVGHGWHTGIVMRTSDVPRNLFPEVADFSHSDFVELGWGDEGFYRAKKITAPLVLKAAFWPTPSVLHVAGFQGPVQEFYQVSDIIEVPLSEEQFHRLCGFIGESFEHSDGRAISLGPGLYGTSTFYRAKGKYFVPKTCNTWTAKALNAAGLATTPQTSITAESVLSQSRRFGRVLQESHPELKRAALGRD